MTESQGSLLRVLGVGFGVAVIVGGAVGVGILRTPGTIAGMLHRPGLILLAWALGGAYALLQANNLAELATAVPSSGGPYIFARRALGPYGGFVVGWADWLSLVVAMAYLPLAFGEFSARLFPAARRARNDRRGDRAPRRARLAAARGAHREPLAAGDRAPQGTGARRLRDSLPDGPGFARRVGDLASCG